MGRKIELTQVIFEYRISLNTLSVMCKYVSMYIINLKEIFAEEQTRHMHGLSVFHRWLIKLQWGKIATIHREIGQHPDWVIKIVITNDGQLAKAHLQMGYPENGTSSMNYSILECIT